MYNSSFSSKPSILNTRSYQMGTTYPDEYDEDEYQDDQSDQEEAEDEYQNVYNEPQSRRRLKKRRLGLVSNYEFAPRGGASSGEWTEHETFVLLEVWGDMFLQSGRNSLRSEDWIEVAEKVSEATRIERTDMQCRNRLDVLKKKYKKEKAKMAAFGGYVSKWVFFKKVDMLLNAMFSSRKQCGLACGIDSGEYVFTNPSVYLDRSNVLDEMGDSPGESDSDDNDEEMGFEERDEENGESSFRLLADSIQKFGKIYEKIESSKRKKMIELEKMRMDFQRELELQQKHILERAHAEIEKLKNEHDDDETDISADDS